MPSCAPPCTHCVSRYQARHTYVSPTPKPAEDDAPKKSKKRKGLSTGAIGATLQI